MTFRDFSPPSPARTANPSPKAAKSTRLTARRRDAADQRQDLVLHILRGQRAHLPETDVAAAVDNVGLRHAVNPKMIAVLPLLSTPTRR